VLSRRRWPRRVAPIAAAAVVLSLLGLVAGVRGTHAETLGGEAAGDSYALWLRGAAGGRPAGLGPLVPVDVRVPPALTASRRSGTVSCGGSAAAAACPGRGVDVLRLAGAAAVATLDPQGTGGCRPAGTAVSEDAGVGRLAPPGAGGCAAAAHVEALRGAAPSGGLIADAVVSRSLTQGCDGSSGFTSLGALEVAGVRLVGGEHPLLASGVPPANWTVTLPPGATGAAVVATVVLNERLADPGGRGLSVNAIHLRSGPASTPALRSDLVVGHSHSWAICPLEVRHEALPAGTEVAFAQVDPAIHHLDAAVAGDGDPACFGGDLRGGGCHEPVADLVARHHAELGITANYSDYVHALGTVIAGHHRLTPDDLHTTTLCVGDAVAGRPVPLSLRKGADPAACRTAVSGERLVTAGRPDIEGIDDRGRRGAFWWSVRPFDHTGRTLAGLRADGTLLVAVASAPPGAHGGLTLPEAAGWLIAHGATDGIALDGGEQADMVLAGGGHPVPLERGTPRVQVALLVGTELPRPPTPDATAPGTPAPASPVIAARDLSRAAPSEGLRPRWPRW
jgi:hypothetical protein